MPTYDIIPMGKPRMTARDKWKGRACVLEYNRFKDEVRLFKVTIPLVPRIVFWMPMPNDWSKKKKAEMAGQPHMQKPDKDNLQKALYDAVYNKRSTLGGDDSHIWCGWCEKRWAYKGSIEITSLPSDTSERMALMK